MGRVRINMAQDESKWLVHLKHSKNKNTNLNNVEKL